MSPADMTAISTIVHCVPAIFGANGRFGGAERYAYGLARAMAERVPTALVAFGHRAERYHDGPLAVTVLEGRALRGHRDNPWSARLLPIAMRADVAHCHQTHLAMSTAVALARRAAAKPTFTSNLGGGGWDLSSYVSTDRLYRGHLHISAYSRRLFGHEHWDRGRVIYGGVDLQRFRPDDSVPRQRRVVFVGRLMSNKGIDVLVRAVPDDVELLVIGRESDPRYTRVLHELADKKRVTFVPDAKDEEVIAAYRTAACAVLPSVHRDYYDHYSPVAELLGQTPLEAMACGTPAIVSDAASLPEVVQDGVTGFVVPQRDVDALRAAILRLVDDAPLRAEMGRAGRRHVESRFSWTSVVDECLRAYRELGGVITSARAPGSSEEAAHRSTAAVR